MKMTIHALCLSLLTSCLLRGMETNSPNYIIKVIEPSIKNNDVVSQKGHSLLTFGTPEQPSNEDLAPLNTAYGEFLKDAATSKKSINMLNNGKASTAWYCNNLQPTVELTSFTKGVDHTVQEQAIKFEPKKQDIFISNDQKSLIERIEARLEDESKCNVGLGIRSETLIEQHKFTISDLNKAQCLCIDPHNQQLLIGSKDGIITIYDMATLYSDKTVKVTSRLMAHTDALHTLGIHKPANKGTIMLLSRDTDNNVLLWNLKLRRPLICVRGKHDNNYLSADGELLIQSHAIKTLGSSLSSYFSENRSFNIPFGWLEGGWENCLSNKIVSPQSLYIYFLGIAHKLSEAREDSEKFLNKLLKAPVRRMFEPEVSNVFEQFIRVRAQELKITLK